MPPPSSPAVLSLIVLSLIVVCPPNRLRMPPPRPKKVLLPVIVLLDDGQRAPIFMDAATTTIKMEAAGRVVADRAVRHRGAAEGTAENAATATMGRLPLSCLN